MHNYVYWELGRYALTILRCIRVIKYWFKVSKCRSTNYIKLFLFCMLLDLNIYPSRTSWAKLREIRMCPMYGYTIIIILLLLILLLIIIKTFINESAY